MKKRDLEELFRERFKDFQETPDERVWQSIEASLDKKKRKKRVIPIWWQLGGVAALLAIMFFIFNPFDTKVDGNETIVTQTEEGDDKDSQRTIIDSEDNGEAAKTQQTVQIAETGDTTVAKEDNGVNRQEEVVKQDVLTTRSSQQSVIVATPGIDSVKNGSRDKGKNEQRFFTPSNDTKETLAISENSENNTNVDNAGQKASDTADVPQIDDEVTVVAQVDMNSETKKEAVDKKENPSSFEHVDAEEEVAVNVQEDIEETDKKSIFDAIKEQEENALAENSKGKWSVGPSVAPIYFNSIGEGSPIHSNFASNTKSGNINLSYGLTVAYDIGERLTIRSGLHKVDFGYDTDDIVFSSSLTSSTNAEIDNINYNQTSRNLVVQSKAQGLENSAPLDQVSADLIARSPEFEGRMVQQLGYLELPVELNYALVDKKFGVNLIGGFSSLFLVDNSVSLESNGLVTEMGEANNVNDINFSTNVGVGFNYEFSPNMKVNLEPVFKYQLNTFSNTAGNFRPYSVGVYSGVSFKF